MTTMGETTTFWLDVRPPSQGEIYPGPINLHMVGKVTGLRGGAIKFLISGHAVKRPSKYFVFDTIE